MTLAVRTSPRPAADRGDAVDRIVAAVASDPAPVRDEPVRDLVGRIRQVSMDQELATVLSLRAERLANPAVAAMLRERATVRRLRADRIRADLAARGVVVHRRAESQ
ncbi:hypothetical protein [Geodermatophilus sp. CPCC 206100]|uniref:hypothetical protein n=1 Tax=Geodermatophilus sp. CPCC 206100 TaxID=3020054 RepID=UPI003B00CF0D